jgi:hypothetical protein
LKDLSSNTIQILLTVSRDNSASERIKFNDGNLFQTLQNLASNASGCIDMLTWARSSVDASTILFTKTTNTGSLAKVYMTSDGSGSDVEPVRVIRCKLSVDTSLYNVNPFRDFETTGSLQISSISLDKFLSRNIFDGNSVALNGQNIIALNS